MVGVNECIPLVVRNVADVRCVWFPDLEGNGDVFRMDIFFISVNLV